MVRYAQLEAIEIQAAVNWMARLIGDEAVQPAQRRAAVLAYRRSSLRLLREAETLVETLMADGSEQVPQ